MQIRYNAIVFTWQIYFSMFSEVVSILIFLESKYAGPIHLIFIFHIEPNMKLFYHANNIVLRRVIYIHNLPGVKLVKHFSLANETWCAVTFPPFDFVKGDCAVVNAVLGKRDINSVQNTIYKIYSRKSTNLTVVALCKTTGKSEMTKSAAMGFFDRAGDLYYSKKKEFRTIAILWLPLTHKSSNTS